jgi:hypothetical protein
MTADLAERERTPTGVAVIPVTTDPDMTGPETATYYRYGIPSAAPAPAPRKRRRRRVDWWAMLILAGMVTVAVPLALVVAHFVPHLTVQAPAVTATAQPHKHGHQAPAGHRPGQAPVTGIPAAPDSPVQPGPAVASQLQPAAAPSPASAPPSTPAPEPTPTSPAPTPAPTSPAPDPSPTSTAPSAPPASPAPAPAGTASPAAS